MARLFTVLGLALALSACGGKGKLKRYDRAQPNLQLPTGELAPVKADVDGVLTAGLDPNSTATQLIKASANSGIANTTIAFPPGAIAIAVDITIKAGSESFSSDLASELGLEGDSAVVGGSVPVQIDASQVVSLSSPFVLAMNLPAGAGLLDTNFDNLALMYQVKNEAEGRLESGIVPRDELTVKDGQALYSSYFFGWFRLVLLSSPLKDRKVVADSKAKANKGLMLLQSGTQLPACGATDVGVTVYLKAEGKFKTCTANGWEDISLTGPKGDTGAAGATGATGPAGSYFVSDANGQELGDFLGFKDQSLVVAFSDGAFFSTTYGGTFAPICASYGCEVYYYDGMQSHYAHCAYAEPNCAGPCYMRLQLKNAIVAAGTTYWKPTTTEATFTPTANSAVSMWDSYTNSCVSGIPAGSIYLPATPLVAYSIPSGKAPPFAAPLAIGKR